MKPFRDFHIQHKLLVMTLLICGAVLFVAIAALFTFQVLNFRSNFKRDTAALAATIANNSTASLAFEDAKAGAEVMASLKAKPTVVSACLALPDRSVFARYGKAEDARTLAQFPPDRGSRFSSGHLLHTQPVFLARERVGTLYLRLDFRHTFRELLGFYGQVVLCVMAVSVGLSVFLCDRLRRAITEPIRVLDETAQAVGEKKDYSVRAIVSPRGDELGRLTESFNEMLNRIESQDAALSVSQQKMEALIHSIDGIVWECTPDDFQFTFVSRQAERLLGYTPEEWLTRPNFWQEKLHPEDAAEVTQTWGDQVARQQPFVGEFRMIAADGRVVWIRESVSVLNENGRPVALRGIFQDITEQKKAAEQLEMLNRKLLETSRYAGMAEVATGVLHNVGNVLNSVSVSATSVSDRLRRSKVANLRRATNMLREQNGRLVEFLTVDPKGMLLPEYLSSVADELAVEQDKMVEKMNTLGQHIEHIKEIVAMQQSYAKISGAFENLSAVALVEDALRINAAAFDRHHIRVIREFEEDTPRVCVDRHKVLQILINLLRNAKYAMDTDDVHDKQLVIGVRMASRDRVKITVRDNGVGISPESLIKIFNHGFTTKKDGHGFGLHSGANAAKAMGGCLTAHSDGPGKGAEFTLELPTGVATRHEQFLSTQATT